MPFFPRPRMPLSLQPRLLICHSSSSTTSLHTSTWGRCFRPVASTQPCFATGATYTDHLTCSDLIPSASSSHLPQSPFVVAHVCAPYTFALLLFYICLPCSFYIQTRLGQNHALNIGDYVFSRLTPSHYV